VLLVDEGLAVRYASTACEKMFGVAEGALDNAVFPDRFLTTLGESTPTEHLAQVLASRQETRFKTMLRDAAGGEAPLEIRAIPVDDGGDECVIVHLMVGEADERIEALMLSIRRIRHEINNPLTGALGNINLLLRRDDLDEKTRRRLTTAEQEMKKISEIVARLADLTASR
jgi:nitrogen-specific signal transduction histidine kinase